MTPKYFVNALSSLKIDNTFNPYRDNCSVFDTLNASKIRKDSLLNLLEAASKAEVDSIWIGRDLGYRGGRRTGLALTDDVNIDRHAHRWGIEIPRVTNGVPIAERTAAVIWSALDNIPDNIFLWNVFPLHPFIAGTPFSNRTHNSKERKIGEDILLELINTIKPKRIIAIGNDAEISANKLTKNLEIKKFRHPSYGGQNTFLKQVESLYEINIQQRQSSLF
ncbi:uracil-DNA glycosylase [Pseudomonas iridis]|uniref:uracil-DNA glycosylase n=1 Tax=Pseudomonas iridis TaxID=2710587 RepID=UPI0021C1C867|nr:uracil-DNA glycosylase [Pseudomonas iridis]MCT8947815.1 uracil-DNA glycosylase [Pseudomonas iridis]